MGPNAENPILNLSDQSLTMANFSRLTAKSINIGGIDVDALRVSYVGESGRELHHDINQQKALFDRLMQAGRVFDMGFYGAFAMNSLRLEKGYRAWGADLTSKRTPLEAGLEWFVWPILGVLQIREMNLLCRF